MKVHNLINDKVYEGVLSNDDGNRIEVTTKQKITFSFNRSELDKTVVMLDDNPKDGSA